MKDLFRRVASRISNAAGSAVAFSGAILLIVVWGITGPVFKFSNTWQLVINTGTTIITFLMVFLIQNTQNRDGKAMQLKLDEIIRASRARNAFIDLEDMTDEEMDLMADQFQKLHDTLNDQAFKKFHAKFREAHERRRSLASQVASALNPFSTKSDGAYLSDESHSSKNNK